MNVMQENTPQQLCQRIAIVLVTLGMGLLASCSNVVGPQDSVAAPGVVTSTDTGEFKRLQALAARVEIIRDDFGVPHIYGKSDADAVFGLLYAQAEDDFPRIEQNYIWAIGRLAQVQGKSALYSDLRAQLFMTEEQARAELAAAPEWLQVLCQSFADGLNYYLATHPKVQPKLLDRFEPWMPMFFFEGSIGGDIEQIPLPGIEAFYSDVPGALAALDESADTPFVAQTDTEFTTEPFKEPLGSNGFAIAPDRTRSGNALLLINPHTSFFFRGEVHVVSEDGLNAYGAVTWGQFFVYQGFNEDTGWMHTSTEADFKDEFLEDIIRANDGSDGLRYRYGDELRDLTQREVSLSYREADGSQSVATFTGYHTHHGPITHQVQATGEVDARWVASRINWQPAQALAQSYLRMKNADYVEFRSMMDRRTNSSNNTVYADSSGNIAYFHGNFMPRRNPRFDYSKPVNGADPETDWQGLHSVAETVHLLNPESGWLQNCNSTPYTAAGKFSPKAADYPAYMAPDSENHRGVHAVRLLANVDDLTLDGLLELAYDPALPGFEKLLQGLISAWDALPAGQNDPRLAAAIAQLRAWDGRVAVDSVSMSVAHFYGLNMLDSVATPAALSRMERIDWLGTNSRPAERVAMLQATLDELSQKFGRWYVPWGEINRYQRLDGNIEQRFDDQASSIAVGMASGNWGALASFGAPRRTDVNKLYGRYGNSFVAAVEFGDRVRAKTLLAGGQSGDPASPHFDDQTSRYADAQFKDVAFYREDVLARAQRRYRPGTAIQ